ncbi:MAG: hypothetical protein ACJAW1_002498, partial [Glaciecola sp.]
PCLRIWNIQAPYAPRVLSAKVKISLDGEIIKPNRLL